MIVGERGPKPDIVQKLSPEERRALDQAIIEGAETKADLHKRFAERHGIAYRSFCTYATALETTSKHRYVGELLNRVFGNLPDSAIDLRARGIMMAMLDRIAADVLHDGDLKPKDLQHVVQSYDILRKGEIAEAQEERRRQDWEVVRAAGIAAGAKLIKRELAAEIAGDPDLRGRLEGAVDRIAGRLDKPVEQSVAAGMLKSLKNKWKLDSDDLELINRIVGVDVRIGERPAAAAVENGGESQ